MDLSGVVGALTSIDWSHKLTLWEEVKLQRSLQDMRELAKKRKLSAADYAMLTIVLDKITDSTGWFAAEASTRKEMDKTLHDLQKAASNEARRGTPGF